MKIKIANKIAPVGVPRFAASHLGLFCLPISNKKDARLICVKLHKETKALSACKDAALLTYMRNKNKIPHDANH